MAGGSPGGNEQHSRIKFKGYPPRWIVQGQGTTSSRLYDRYLSRWLNIAKDRSMPKYVQSQEYPTQRHVITTRKLNNRQAAWVSLLPQWVDGWDHAALRREYLDDNSGSIGCTRMMLRGGANIVTPAWKIKASKPSAWCNSKMLEQHSNRPAINIAQPCLNSKWGHWYLLIVTDYFITWLAVYAFPNWKGMDGSKHSCDHLHLPLVCVGHFLVWMHLLFYQNIKSPLLTASYTSEKLLSWRWWLTSLRSH
jgi:hypothetical protein